jgi:hypothetical protein
MSSTQIKRRPNETKEEAKLRAQKEAQTQIESDRRDMTEAHRTFCTGFKFWKLCGHKECERRHACVGVADLCFDRFFRLFPEKTKVYVRAFVTARARDKLPPYEAVRHAKREMARYLEMEARFARQKAEQEAAQAAKFAPPQPHYVPEDRAPRVRSW